MTISIGKGLHLNPTLTLGSGTAMIQLGTMSAVASRNLAATWFSTWPLNGMASGRITSKAEIRSLATMISSSSWIVYTSRTFPWYNAVCPGNRKEVFFRVFMVCLLIVFRCHRMLPGFSAPVYGGPRHFRSDKQTRFHGYFSGFPWHEAIPTAACGEDRSA